MSLKVSTERLPQSQIKLEIEVEDARVQKAVDAAFRRLAAKVKVPGFRQGKVPRAVLERHLGDDVLFHEAIDDLLPIAYKEALEQEDIDPVDRAEYELVSEQPLVARFTVPVQASVDLAGYRDVRVEAEAVEVDPDRVEEGMEALRHRYATLEPVDRAVQWGDIVRADVHGSVGGNVIVNEEDAEFQLLEERPLPLPGFAEGLIGHEKGEQFEVDAKIPEDEPEERFGGKQVHYRIQINELKEEILPELDDEFARQVGEGFSDIAALRAHIVKDIRSALEDQAAHRRQDLILDEVVKQAELEYAPVVVQREAERLLQDQAATGQAGSARGERAAREQLDRYLERAGKSEEDLLEDLRPVAEARIQRSLVLSEVAEAEHIEVNDGEVEAEIGRMTSNVGEQADEVRHLFSTENAKESVRRSLLTKKTLDRLVQIASGEAAPAEEAQAAEEAQTAEEAQASALSTDS